MKKRVFGIICMLFALLMCGSSVFADIIHLKNGNKVSGVITKESEDFVEIKINIGAVVTFSKKDIDRVEKESDDERLEIEKGWEAEKAQREGAAGPEPEIDETFKEEQREKGLVEYEGDWVTPEEKERLQAASIATGKHSETRFSKKEDKEKRSDFSKKLLDKGNWFVRETEHFSIYYRDKTQSKIVSDKAEYYFEKISYDLGYEGEIKWDRKCQVYIVEDADKWKSFLKNIGFNAELVGGFVPNYGEKEMFLCALSEGYLAVTFPHELTHLIFSDIAGSSTIPLWLNEGLANYEASVTSLSNNVLVKYIKEGRHILLGDLLRMARYPDGKDTRELFYAQSEKMVEFLITQYGRKKFRKFCEFILKDRSFRESLLGAYRGDFEGLEDFNIKLVEYIVK